MTQFLKQHYGDTEGPLGIPMLDQQAQRLDKIIRQLPDDELHQPGKLALGKATTELLTGERADVSWISTENVDRMREIVKADGMNDEHFQLNPLVTMQHAYWLPPVGRSLWRTKVKTQGIVGIKAKTHYPTRPEDWSNNTDWPPDVAFSLVKQGLLTGKSIGFLPTKVRTPTEEEIKHRPEMRHVKRIVEEWILLEYACVFLPAQQHAVVEAVSKEMAIPAEMSFTTLKEIERHVQQRIANLDFEQLAQRAWSQAWDKARGRI